MNLLASLWLVASVAHPFHVSVAMAEWNTESGTLEVALRCQPIDLEDAVNLGDGKRIELEKAEKQVRAYVCDVIQVTTSDDQLVKPIWVGMELADAFVWVYFEIPLKDGPTGATLTNRLFFGQLEDQVNLVTIKDGKQKRSFSFTPDVPSHAIRFNDD